MIYNVDFQEKEEEHAQRLHVSRNFVRVRKRLLKRLLQGASERELIDWKFRGNNVIPWLLLDATPEEVMTTLAVKPAGELDGNVLFIPTGIVETPDLAHGRMIQAIREWGFKFGGEGLPRTRLIPPYGYRRDGDHIVPAGRAARAIRLAFQLILEYEGSAGPVRWSEIADELNRRGYVRKNGLPWTGDDVRDLTRITTYAGVYRPWKKENAPVEVRDEFDPLISLPDFIRAARLGRGTDRYGRAKPWLKDLEKFLETKKKC